MSGLFSLYEVPSKSLSAAIRVHRGLVTPVYLNLQIVYLEIRSLL